MNALLRMLAVIGLLSFVGILVWKVPEPDLIAVAALTVGLAMFDFATTGRGR